MADQMKVTTVAGQESCPCGSGLSLADCCLPRISGSAPADTAQALMRSRYTAYVLGNTDYLASSWHASTRPEQLDAGAQVEWLGLQVVACKGGLAGDTRGSVAFIAHYRQQGIERQAQENSRFVREGGVWLYLDGDLKSPETIGRNDPCRCGSGRKFKKCCGR